MTMQDITNRLWHC